MSDSKKSMKREKIRRWFEPIGLALLLFSFGWQCLEDQSKQMQMESYLYETNEKLVAIWDGIYDEALHSDRYEGETTVAVNYDAMNQLVKDWGDVKEEMIVIDSQLSIFIWVRIVLYVIGSVFIFFAKIPNQRHLSQSLV